MARLTINSFEGDSFSVWFNDELTGKKYFDASEWAKAVSASASQRGYTEDEAADSWTISKTKIRFEQQNAPTTINSNGEVTTQYNDIFVEWNGKFKTKGDRIIGGQVTSFSRDWGRSYGSIDVTNIKYDLKKEMGNIWSLTLPNEITSHFSGTIGTPQYNEYGQITNSVDEYLRTLPAGSAYDFATPYG